MPGPESYEATASREYRDLATLFAGLTEPDQPLVGKSNREVWGNCLDTRFLEKHLPGKCFIHIPKLVRFYESILDGSCGVERGLATVRAFITENRTHDIGVIDDLAVLVDADLQPEDVARNINGHYAVGGAGKEFGALWREVLGARLGIHGKHTHKAKPGTWKNVKAGVLKAIGAAIVAKPGRLSSTAHVGQPLAAQGTPSLASVLAARAAGDSTGAGTCRSPYWHKGFTCVNFIFARQVNALHFGGFALEFKMSSL